MSRRHGFYRHESRGLNTDPDAGPLPKWRLKLETPVIETSSGGELIPGSKKDAQPQDGPVKLGFQVRRWVMSTGESMNGDSSSVDDESSEFDFEIEDDLEEFGTDVKERGKSEEPEVQEEEAPAAKLGLFSSEVPAATKRAKRTDDAQPSADAPQTADASMAKDMEEHPIVDTSMGDDHVQEVDPVGTANEPVLAPVHDQPAPNSTMPSVLPVGESQEQQEQTAPIAESAPLLPEQEVPQAEATKETATVSEGVLASPEPTIELPVSKRNSVSPAPAEQNFTVEEVTVDTQIQGVASVQDMPMDTTEPTIEQPSPKPTQLEVTSTASLPEALVETIEKPTTMPVAQRPTPAQPSDTQP